MKHHEFSPSKLERIEKCPWSYKNCIGWINAENKNAAHGTLLHEAIWNDDVFAKLESDKDKKMIRAIREEHVLPYKTLKCFHEIKLQIFSEDHGELLTEGIADFLVISADGKSASLKDWKFGGYEVTEAKDNAQIHAYVCGVFQQFSKLEKVYALIVQPIFGMCDYQKQHCFTRAELPDMLNRIAESIDRAKSAEPADANPTSENCRYCNKFACPAYRQWMDTNLAIIGFSPAALSFPEQEMTIEYADKLLVAEKEITAIMEEKSNIAKKIILDNDGSENFRVSAGRVTKKTDWEKVCEDADIDPQIIEKNTTETVGEPYLVSRTRKKTTKKLNEGI